jgi:hypothetical protein
VESGAVSAQSTLLTARLDLLESRLKELEAGLPARVSSALAGLEFLVDEVPRGRRQLAALRASSAYQEAFTDPHPLVSIVISTWDRAESLTTVAIPSVLAQTYENVEVVVVGDNSAPELCEAVAAIEDPRVRFHNLTIRGPYEEDTFRAWCGSGVPPMNAALACARGRWIGFLGDDDSFSPTQVERLLAFAQARRLEFVYGWYRFLDPDGGRRLVGSFPPQLGDVGLQPSLWHGGLRFLQFELAHATLAIPNDWGMIRRMMRIGVSMGQTDDVIFDYVPSGRVTSLDEAAVPDANAQLRRRIAEVYEQTYELEAQRASLRTRLDELERRAQATTAELHRRLEEVRRSRSWRMTAPLRFSTELARRLRNAGR